MFVSIAEDCFTNKIKNDIMAAMKISKPLDWLKTFKLTDCGIPENKYEYENILKKAEKSYDKYRTAHRKEYRRKTDELGRINTADACEQWHLGIRG